MSNKYEMADIPGAETIGIRFNNDSCWHRSSSFEKFLLALCAVLLVTLGGLIGAIVVMKNDLDPASLGDTAQQGGHGGTTTKTPYKTTLETTTRHIEASTTSMRHESTKHSTKTPITTPITPGQTTTTTTTTQTRITTRTPRPTTTQTGTTTSRPLTCVEYPCLVFEDNFDDFNLDVWEHEITASGGGNWEFEYYLNNRTNSYVRDGKLFIKPTLTSDRFGEQGIRSGTLDLWGIAANDVCTGGMSYGCMRVGSGNNIINPIQSAKLRSVRGFNMRYGKLEIVAKLPTGDWIWPAIWMLPRWLRYGGWPASGEIDIMESRGNRNTTAWGEQIGVNFVGTTLHFGPDYWHNRYFTAQGHKVLSEGTFGDEFHTYGLEWDEAGLKTTVDGEVLMDIRPGVGGFWEFGGLSGSGVENPWGNSNSTMAPFDEEFYIILNVAVGGTGGFFPEVPGKPWSNTSPNAFLDFWNARDQWYPTWNPDIDNGEHAALVIDSVRYWKMRE